VIIALSLGGIVGGKEMATEKTCFIIMPITTPEFMLEKYRDGKEHFKHVLECLFVPGVQKAGYQVISPIAKGSDLIHAGIVHNLETADIVLCDMSCLNPNVFFEFGIRTSLNKPVSVVKDELTDKVPFDAAILNYHQYKSSLETWENEAETKVLSEHITASAERSKNQNTLWKYFGLKTTAAPSEGEGGTEAKLDYLLMKVDSLSKNLPGGEEGHKYIPWWGGTEETQPAMSRTLGDLIDRKVLCIKPDGDALQALYLGPPITHDNEIKVQGFFREIFGKSVQFKLMPPLPPPKE
jgi:hypothetical protein